MTNLKSFEDVGKFWLSEVANYGDTAVNIMLLGNKCDMNTQPREVSLETAEQYARENKMKHYEVSAKTADHVRNSIYYLRSKKHSNISPPKFYKKVQNPETKP